MATVQPFIDDKTPCVRRYELKREEQLSSYLAPTMQKLNARKLPARQPPRLHFFRQVGQSSFSLFRSFFLRVYMCHVYVYICMCGFYVCIRVRARPRPHQF